MEYLTVFTYALPIVCAIYGGVNGVRLIKYIYRSEMSSNKPLSDVPSKAMMLSFWAFIKYICSYVLFLIMGITIGGVIGWKGMKFLTGLSE